MIQGLWKTFYKFTIEQIPIKHKVIASNNIKVFKVTYCSLQWSGMKSKSKKSTIKPNKALENTF